MLIALAGSAEQAVARNTAYMAKVQSMSVQVEATSSDRPGVGKATLLFKKPDSIAFDLKWGDEDYSLRANGKKILEVERNSKMYAEHEPTGMLRLPPLDLSRGVGLAMPGMLLQKGITSAMPPGAQLKMIGSETISGLKSDHIRANFKTQVAEVTIDAWIDQKGALRRYDIQVMQAMSRFVNSLKLSNYKVNPPTSPNQFTMGLPIGYVPFVFDTEPAVIGQGKKLKVEGLTGVNGKPFDLQKWLSGKKTLLVVAGKDCQPSRTLLANLKSISNGVRTVAIVPDRSLRPAASLVLIDAKGASLAATSTPSTPLIALLDSKGVVAQVWIGFNESSANQLASEIRTISAQVK